LRQEQPGRSVRVPVAGIPARSNIVQIQVRTDNHIHGSAELQAEVQALLEEKLKRFQPRITRIEAHFTDENSSGKSADDDKRCVLEARLNGLDPVSVADRAATVRQALHGAARKLVARLETVLGKLEHR